MSEKTGNFRNNKDRLKEIIDSIEKGIKEVFESGRYTEYLQVMSRFHNYSFNNTLLIYMQKPDATLVAGFNKWKDKFERNVNKGEKGIKIIAPTPYKKKIEKDVLDPDTKLPMRDENGEIIKEEKEVSIPSFRPVTVFDVSQTSGKELPTLASDLNGKVENFDMLKEAISRSAPVPISFKPLRSDTDGYFSPKRQEIVIREGMGEVQTVCAMIHESAHAKLHNPANIPETDDKSKLSRSDEEVQAESIAYTVCAYFGIETGENSFGYLASWSQNKELKELKESLDIINKTSSDLITAIEKNYKAIVKERGAELTDTELKEPAIETPQTEDLSDIPVPDPAISREALLLFGYTDDNMLPLTKSRAAELFMQDIPVYCIYTDNSESLIETPEALRQHDGMFGIEKADWAKALESFKEKEKTFLESPSDAFALYQLIRSEATDEHRFMNTEFLEKHGLEISRDNYSLIATGELKKQGETVQVLDSIYEDFNIHLPIDYKGQSCSVSDIIALKRGNDVSFYYVDSIGFTPVHDFLPQRNYLKNAEISTEDDYGMIDGVINNGKKPETDYKSKQNDIGKKPSVLKRLEDAKKQAGSLDNPMPKKTERNLIQ
ncbi:MAG: YodL domain-containing protein [Acutalibacteraceae bacterium]|nr:YodL domain-containing protein [Acutalibacteraceae bacterium]